MRSSLAVILSFVPFLAHGQNIDCACDRENLLENVRTAKTIIYGSIREATMASASSETIELTLDVRDPIRGSSTGIAKVWTTRQYNCGVPAIIGNHSLFVIAGPNEPVTLCGGSGFYHYPSGHELEDIYQLVFALVTVEYADKDPTIVREWLDRKFRKGRSRKEDMDSFISLIGDLDTETIMTATDNEVTYKNLVFVFNDGVLFDYFWKEDE